jgi:nucleoside 2-deoxyribosyltransferase
MDVTVVGGAYHEVCIDPTAHRLMGSGLRAARLLRALGADASLSTCVDAATASELGGVAAAFDVAVSTTPRATPVRYVYETPVHPAIQSGSTSGEPIHADGEVVVGFGMIETEWTAKGDRVVIDPQHSEVAELLGRVRAPHLALVLNEHEARRFAGRDDLRDAARYFVELGIDAVAIKRGARGGLVATASRVDAFGAVPTRRVDPIGSGDAFTAGFAYAWAGQAAEPLEAARFASRVAAAHSLEGAAGFNADVLANVGEPIAYPQDSTPSVYLAGPFFNVAQRMLIRVARRALRHLGVDVFSPLHEIGHGGDEVAELDLAGLGRCSSVLAILDGADSGTVFETGWATRANIPVVALAENADDHAWTMHRGTEALVVPDLSSAIYNAAWAALGRDAKK